MQNDYEHLLFVTACCANGFIRYASNYHPPLKEALIVRPTAQEKLFKVVLDKRLLTGDSYILAKAFIAGWKAYAAHEMEP